MGLWVLGGSRSPPSALGATARPQCPAVAPSRAQSHLVAFSRHAGMQNVHGVAQLLLTPARQRFKLSGSHSRSTARAHRQRRRRFAGERAARARPPPARARAAALRAGQLELSATAGVLQLPPGSWHGELLGARSVFGHVWALRGASLARPGRPRAEAGCGQLQRADGRRLGSICASTHCGPSRGAVHGRWLAVL